MAKNEKKKTPAKQRNKGLNPSAAGMPTTEVEAIEFHNERRALKDLVPFAKNPRFLKKEGYEALKKSLEKFSLAEIPVINTDNTIVAGHQRIRILKILNAKNPDFEIDVRVPNRTLTQKEFEEYNIRSNKNVGEFDIDILANEFDINDLLSWGFSKDELGLGDVNVDDFFSNELGEEKVGKESKTTKITCPHCGKEFEL